jgi:hypothetical protein
MVSRSVPRPPWFTPDSNSLPCTPTPRPSSSLQCTPKPGLKLVVVHTKSALSDAAAAAPAGPASAVGCVQRCGWRRSSQARARGGTRARPRPASGALTSGLALAAVHAQRSGRHSGRARARGGLSSGCGWRCSSQARARGGTRARPRTERGVTGERAAITWSADARPVPSTVVLVLVYLTEYNAFSTLHVFSPLKWPPRVRTAS